MKLPNIQRKASGLVRSSDSVQHQPLWVETTVMSVLSFPATVKGSNTTTCVTVGDEDEEELDPLVLPVHEATSSTTTGSHHPDRSRTTRIVATHGHVATQHLVHQITASTATLQGPCVAVTSEPGRSRAPSGAGSRGTTSQSPLGAANRHQPRRRRVPPAVVKRT